MESNGIGWIFLSTFVSREREEEKKRDVGWRASLEPRGFFHSRRVGSFEGVAFPAVDSAEECWVIPLV